MANYVYETHKIENPLLPFIYHKSFVVTQRHSLPNWHENIEILYCVTGKGSVQCGAESFEFLPGDLFLVNANTPHCVCSDGSVVYRCLIIDNSFCVANGIPILDLYFQKLIQDEALARQFEEIGAAFDRGSDPMAAADIRYGVLGLLRLLCAGYITEKPSTVFSAANQHVKDALTYIRKNISSPLTLDTIAGHVGVSKFHLAREFKAFTGRTMVQTINLIRCSEAKRLMESGMSVSAGAAECGFENLSYFSRTFKELFHRLPSSFVRSSAVPMVERDDDEEDCY